LVLVENPLMKRTQPPSSPRLTGLLQLSTSRLMERFCAPTTVSRAVRQYVLATANAVDEQTSVPHDMSHDMSVVSQTMPLIADGNQQIATETEKVRVALDGTLGDAKPVLASNREEQPALSDPRAGRDRPKGRGAPPAA
jgi:hypothetical protein